MFSFSLLSGLRKLLNPIALFFALIGLAACDPGAFGPVTSSPSFDSSKPVQVALLVPSGSGSSTDELVAQNLENAARLAIADLNGVDVALRVYATAANPQTAASQATKAVQEGAVVILGPLYAEAANAAGLAVA